MEKDRKLCKFMGHSAPEIELMRKKVDEVTRTTKAQGERLVSMLTENEELSCLEIGSPCM